MSENKIRNQSVIPSLSWLRKFFAQPPSLQIGYKAPEYFRFMCEETQRFSPRYAKKYVEVHEGHKLIQLTKERGAVLAPLHYGSFFLSGGAVVHQLHLRCTAIVTHNNLLVLPDQEADMWREMHSQAQRLHEQPIFYAGVTPRDQIVQYLSKPHNLLWAMMDVREAGRDRPEFPFTFQERKVFLQTGAERLACIARVPLIPMCIKYDLSRKQHNLYIGEPISPGESPIEMTQKALTQLEVHTTDDPEQFFHDMNFFSVPSPLNQPKYSLQDSQHT